MDTHSKPPKLMDQVKATMRVKRYSPRTEKTYCYWIRYFIRFHGVRHPASMGGPEVRAFLEHLAVQRHVAAATQNQALNALVFLYRHVLGQLLGDIGEMGWSVCSSTPNILWSPVIAMGHLRFRHRPGDNGLFEQPTEY